MREWTRLPRLDDLHVEPPPSARARLKARSPPLRAAGDGRRRLRGAAQGYERWLKSL